MSVIGRGWQKTTFTSVKRSIILLFLLAAILTAVAGVLVRVNGGSKALGDLIIALATITWLVFLGLMLYRLTKTMEKNNTP